MSRSFRKLQQLSFLMLTVVLTAIHEKPAAADPPAAEEVSVPDENLASVLKDILKRKAVEGEAFTAENLQKIYYLQAIDRQIQDLTGLEHCTNLAEVRLSQNAIQDVSPLAACVNIQSLDLAGNKITSIDPLRALTKLQYLNVENNQIPKLDAVTELKALASLYADGNQIESLDPLKDLPKLHSLYAAGNRISDVQPVATLVHLDSLDLSGNQIEDVSALKSLHELRFTFLMKNRIRDISPLAEMARADNESERRFAPYWRLYLAENPLDADGTQQQFEILKAASVRVDLKYIREQQ
ncbi:MAG: leucine-rich repeat protein [Planctomycetaceae bacterium]